MYVVCMCASIYLSIYVVSKKYGETSELCFDNIYFLMPPCKYILRRHNSPLLSNFQECPVGTYKDVDGSDEHLCIPCPLDLLPNRANFIYQRGIFDGLYRFYVPNFSLSLIFNAAIFIAGGVTKYSCPYRCISDKYGMPNCYTPLEELIYTFGGPWPFSVMLSFILFLLALLLSTLRTKLIGSGSYHSSSSIEHHNHHSFPHLLSLSEVLFLYQSLHCLIRSFCGNT
jgi:hypothetical protein